MEGATACIILGDQQAADELSESLHRLRVRVVVTRSVAEAYRNSRYLSPDLFIIGILEAARERQGLGRLLEGEGGRATPAVAALGESRSARREALSLGLTNHLVLPCEDDELALLLQATLGSVLEASGPLTGSLSVVSLSELLTMFDADRREVHIRLERGGKVGHVTLRGGQVQTAHIEGGDSGESAVDAMLQWHEGRFVADLGTGESHSATPSPAPVGPVAPPTATPWPVAPPTGEPRPAGRAALSTGSPMAVDRRTGARESSLSEANAAPAGPTVVHQALTVLNTLSSLAMSFIDSAIVARNLSSSRRILLDRLPGLDIFEVHHHGFVALSSSGPMAGDEVDPKNLVAATAEWILLFRLEVQRAFPGALPAGTLRIIADAAGDELKRLGFLDTLERGG